MRTFAPLLLALAACSRDEAPAPTPSSSAAGSSLRSAPATSTLPSLDPPRLLFLPDGGDEAPPSAPFGELDRPSVGSRCPPDMVRVMDFCIDRYESTLLDSEAGRALSPYYHPGAGGLSGHYERWKVKASDATTLLGRSTEVPAPPSWQLRGSVSFLAVSRAGVVPNGYLDLEAAQSACRNAGKRLCTRDQWMTACRGERRRKFPYGDRYVDGSCNVFRPSHPALLLHGDASRNHLDPRLNLVTDQGKPLLRKTGKTPLCQSQWGSDAVFDMVGNLDEWVDDEAGVFMGGFYSRSTREGCDAAVSSHAPEYFDYSLGARCCSALQ